MTMSPEQGREQRPGGGPACGPGSGLGPDAWFPIRETDPAVEVLVACAGCPVRRSCLASALDRPEVGIWAGTTTQDRAHARTALRIGIPAGIVLDQLLATGATRAHDARVDWTAQEPVAS